MSTAPSTTAQTRDAAGAPPSATPPADVLLVDGTIAVVRPLEPADAAAVEQMCAAVNDDNRRLRFFTVSRHVADQYVEHVLTSRETLTLVAVRRGEVVGMATAEPLDADSAEVAFLVGDRWHGLGIGSLLLEHLAAAARDRGISRFVADVLLENRGMTDVFRHAGFCFVEQVGPAEMHVEMDIGSSSAALIAADEREFVAEQRSLWPLLHPRSVAVYGVRRDGSGVGAAVLRSIVAGGFTGTLHAVHPTAAVVGGIAAVASLTTLESSTDFAVVAVPAERVLDALADAAAAGTHAAVVLSSGFGELGEEGDVMQRQLLAFARSHDLRVVGPNCLGLVVNDPEIRLDATFSNSAPPRGGLAVASQSGGVGIVLADVARSVGLGVHTFVSLGNKCDVSSNDLLAAWLKDPTVKAAALYLESFGNAPKFARFARRFSEKKPLLAVVGGRSAGGRRGGASHTAAAASSGVGVDALFAQAGVIACTSAEDLAETALLITEQPLPAGPRLAILSNAGGMGVLAADAAEEAGLTVPLLTDALRDRISAHVHGTTGTTNPVDAGAAVPAGEFGQICDALLASDEVDALLVVLVATGVTDASTAAQALADARVRHPDKPVVLVPAGGLQHAAVDLPGITRLGTVSAAVRALARAARHFAWRAEPREHVDPVDVTRAARARTLAAGMLVDHQRDGRWLDAPEVERLLDDYGLTPAGRVATGREEILRAAEEVGYPLAVKVALGSVVHKTERGLVRIGVTSRQELGRALDSFERELQASDIPVLIQPMVTGVEVATGLVRDPSLGPLVMVGAGGVATEVWADRAFLLPPVTRRDVRRALQSLRTWPLLTGFRGSAVADVHSLEDVVLRLAQLAEEVPHVVEMDLNPVVVGTTGSQLLDVKVHLAAPGPLDAGVPRRLRSPVLP